MKRLTDTMVLNNGVEIPVIGFGTWQSTGEEAYQATLWALEAGYRHIDTAAAYGNEEMIGKAIADSKVKREEIFVTSKLWNQVRGYEETKKACLESIEKLGIGYLDLYLIHWPRPQKYHDTYLEMNEASYKAMIDLQKEGKIRAIGVSNFYPYHIEDLVNKTGVMPQVNQIKLHPGVIQQEIIDYCREHNILVEAYSPLGTGRLLESTELLEIAKKHNHSVAQVCIRYLLQKGFLPLPKSVHKERIIDNTRVFDFSLDEADMREIDNIPNYGTPARDSDNIPF